MFQNLTKFDVNSRCHLGFIREVFSSVLSPIRLLPSFRSSFAKRKRKKGGAREIVTGSNSRITKEKLRFHDSRIYKRIQKQWRTRRVCENWYFQTSLTLGVTVRERFALNRPNLRQSADLHLKTFSKTALYAPSLVPTQLVTYSVKILVRLSFFFFS